MSAILTTGEIAYLKSELSPHFGVAPKLADGFLLRSWKSGPNRGQPRIPAAVASLRDRRLLEVRQSTAGQPFRAYFTADGFVVLSAALFDHHLLDPKRFAHVAAELQASRSENACKLPL